MMRLKFNTSEFKEILVVGTVMMGILLPARVAFVTFIGDSWFGSFGVISAIAIIILLLAQKNKLGWFGKAFLKQMFKLQKGKRRYFTYFMVAFGIFFTISIIYGIELGKTTLQEETEDFRSQIPEDQQNMEAMMQQTKNIKPTDFILAIFAIFYLLFFQFDVFAILVTILNQISNNMFSHLAPVFLVEQLEFLGMLLFIKLRLKHPTT